MDKQCWEGNDKPPSINLIKKRLRQHRRSVTDGVWHIKIREGTETYMLNETTNGLGWTVFVDSELNFSKFGLQVENQANCLMGIIEKS